MKRLYKHIASPDYKVRFNCTRQNCLDDLSFLNWIVGGRGARRCGLHREGCTLEESRSTRGRSRSPATFSEDHPNLSYSYLPHCRWLIMHLARANPPLTILQAPLHAARPLVRAIVSRLALCSSGRFAHGIAVIAGHNWQTRKSTELYLSPGTRCFSALEPPRPRNIRSRPSPGHQRETDRQRESEILLMTGWFDVWRIWVELN